MAEFEFYDQAKDHDAEGRPATWSDLHAAVSKRVIMTKHGVGRFSNNLGHGADCPQCSAGILEDQEADLNRDEHFKNAMSKHLGDGHAS